MKDRITGRIVELEKLQQDMTARASELKVQLATTEAEAVEIREEIASNVFENRPESKELSELKTAKKWVDIYTGRDQDPEETESEEQEQ